MTGRPDDAVADYTVFASDLVARRMSDEDRLAFEIAMRLRRLSSLVQTSANNAVERGGFSGLGDYLVAALLRRSDQALQPSEIADRLMITRAGATGRLERLERQAMVKRTPIANDRRAWLISLTKTGERAADQGFRALRESEKALFEGLDQAAQQQLADHLRLLLAPLDPSPPS